MRIAAFLMAAGVTVWVAAAGQVFGASPGSLQEFLRVDNMEIGATTGFYIHRVEEGADVKRFSARPTAGYFLADRTLGYLQGGVGASQSAPPAGSAASRDRVDLYLGTSFFFR